MLKSIKKTRSDVGMFINELFSLGHIKAENKILIKTIIVSRKGDPKKVNIQEASLLNERGLIKSHFYSHQRGEEK